MITTTTNFFLLLTISVLIISVAVPNANATIEMDGIILTDPINGECIGDYDITRDSKNCVRSDERVDCDSDPDNSLCNSEMGRNGIIFCDLYAGLTGSRIAYGGCYDRNDNPEDYCEHYREDDEEFCEIIEK